MSSFTKPLIVEHLNGKFWELKEGFDFYRGKETIQVPAGFVTDFASIPRLFWMLIGHPTGKYGKAAAIHDYCYQTGLHSRKESDKILYEGLVILKVAWWKRKIMYYAVRVFGRSVWKKYRR